MTTEITTETFDDEIETIKSRSLHRMQEDAKLRQNQNDALRALGGRAIDMTDSNFYQTVSKYPLMLVDFWAPWCMPCRMVSPVVDQLAREYAGKIAFGRLNVDENPSTANQFGIQGIPTLMLLRQGEVVDQLTGAYPKHMIDARIKAHL